MKKTLVALAALAATASFAQSSVTISGRLDLGMSSLKTSPVVNGVVGASTTRTDLTGNQSGRTTSRLTFAGTEDLGGGLRANFNIETGLNPSDDAGLFAGSTRTGMVQLAGGFGAVTLGTFLNSIDATRGFSASTFSVPGGDFPAKVADLSYAKPVLDGATGSAANSAAALGISVPTYTALTAGVSGRSRNAIAYSSPNMGGLTFSAGIHNQKNVVAGLKTTGTSVSVAYANGPLSTRLAISNGKAATVAGVNVVKNADTAFAVRYNLGVAVPYFLMENTKASNIDNTGLSISSNGWEIGSTFPMGALTPYVTLSRGKTKAAGVSVGKVNAFQVGTTYDLSKRTYLYVATGSDTAKSTLAGPANSVKRTGYSAGLVHSF